jgi:hypothetical protein
VGRGERGGTQAEGEWLPPDTADETQARLPCVPPAPPRAACRRTHARLTLQPARDLVPKQIGLRLLELVAAAAAEMAGGAGAGGAGAGGAGAGGAGDGSAKRARLSDDRGGAVAAAARAVVAAARRVLGARAARAQLASPSPLRVEIAAATARAAAPDSAPGWADEVMAMAWNALEAAAAEGGAPE